MMAKVRAAGEDLRRLEPERPPQDDDRPVLAAGQAGADGVDAGVVGRGRGGRRRATSSCASRPATCSTASPSIGDLFAPVLTVEQTPARADCPGSRRSLPGIMVRCSQTVRRVVARRSSPWRRSPRAAPSGRRRSATPPPPADDHDDAPSTARRRRRRHEPSPRRRRRRASRRRTTTSTTDDDHDDTAPSVGVGSVRRGAVVAPASAAATSPLPSPSPSTARSCTRASSATGCRHRSRRRRPRRRRPDRASPPTTHDDRVGARPNRRSRSSRATASASPASPR